MSLLDLLALLAGRGITLRLNDVCQPVASGTVSPDVLTLLKEHREELADYLWDEKCLAVVSRVGFPPDECMPAAYREWLERNSHASETVG